ncbi:MAG: HD domain-containing protein [Planctomycetota bacterium]|nr:MAG: HD domain-containing protein [Planctomycetota bacterium]
MSGEQQGEELSFLRAGEAEARLGMALTSALKVSRLHALDNVAVKDAVAALSEGLTRFLLLRDEAVFLISENRVYINGRLARAGGAGHTWMDEFCATLGRLGLGGIIFSGSWTEPTVRQFLGIVLEVDRKTPAPERPRALRLALGSELPPGARARVLDPAQAELFVKEEEEGYVSPRERAAYYFARLLALVEASHAAVATGSSPDVHSRHLRQTLMRTVESLPQRPFLIRLLSLTCLPPLADAPLASHSVNVCVLSLTMGQLLGLRRASLIDLGFAALYHDLGRVGHEPVPSAEGDREATASAELHILRGLERCLRARNYGSGGLLRLIVSQEHHRVADGYPDAPALREPHLFSQVVAVADAFDRLQNGTEWRPPQGPRAALRLLEGDDRYPAEATRLLVDSLGRWPRGTTARLWDGSVGVVLDGGAPRGHRPLVRRVVSASMAPDEERALIELPDPDELAEEVDPADYAIDWRAEVVD